MALHGIADSLYHFIADRFAIIVETVVDERLPVFLGYLLQCHHLSKMVEWILSDRTIFEWYLVHILKVLILYKVTKLYPKVLYPRV